MSNQYKDILNKLNSASSNITNDSIVPIEKRFDNKGKYNAKKIREYYNNDIWHKINNFLNPSTDSKENDERGTWFNNNSSGTVLDKTVNTLADVGLNFGKGIISAGEKLGDLVSYGVAGVADIVGAKDYANTVREGAQLDLTNIMTNPVQKNINQYSVFGDKIDSIVQSIGESYANAQLASGLGAKVSGTKLGKNLKLDEALNIPVSIKGKTINVPATSLLTGMSSGMTEAYKKGGNDSQALIKGITSGLAEGFSEGFFGVFNQGGSAFEDKIMFEATKKIENELTRRLTKTGIQALGEGAEEGLSYIFNYVADNAQDIVNSALGKELNKMGDNWNWNELGENILSGAIAGGVSSGASQLFSTKTTKIIEQTQHDVENKLNRPLNDQEKSVLNSSVVKQLSNGTNGKVDTNKILSSIDMLSTTTKNDKIVIDYLTNEKVQELEKNGKKVSNKEKSKIEESIRESLNNGIELNKITDILNGDINKEIALKNENINQLTSRLEDINNQIKDSKFLDKDLTSERQVLEQQARDLREEVEALKNQYNDNMNSIYDENSILNKSYKESLLKQQEYQPVKSNSKFAEQINKDLKNIKANNSTKTHQTVENILKISDDLNKQYRITDSNSQEIINEKNRLIEEYAKNNNVSLEEATKEFENKTIDGYVDAKTGQVFINLDSSRAIEFILGHETTHLLEGTKEYTKLQQAVKDYIQKHGLTNDLKERYKGINANLDNELTSDFAGEYLFNNQDFINSLAVNNNSIFTKIYDYIKHLGKTLTAGSKEARDLEKIKYRYQQAYKYAKDNGINENKDSIVNKNNKSWVKADRQVITGNDPNVWAEQVEKYINETIRDNKDVIIYGIDGDKLTITSNTAGKAKFRNNVKQSDGTIRPMTNEEFAAKLRAESHIDELAQVSKDNGVIKPDYKNHVFAKDGFAYRTAYFEDLDGKYYKISMSVGLNGDIKSIYNVGVMKNMTQKKETGKIIGSKAEPVSRTDNISQNDTKVNRDSLSTNSNMQNENKYSLTQDNQGRELSKEQQEYFKDSKVRDENGKLQVYYNGSGNHTEYLPEFMSDESIWGKGIYLSPYKQVASQYGENIKEAYVNITNPIMNNKNLSFEQYNEFYKATHDGEEAYIEDYDMYDNDFDLLWDATDKGSWADYADELIEYTGYDGLIINPEESVEGDDFGQDEMVIAFKSNQIKNVDNINPTDNPDIRMSLSNKNDIAPVKENLTYGKDIKIQEAIAPLNNKIDELTKKLEKLIPTSDDINKSVELPKDPTKESSYDNELTDKQKRKKVIDEYRQLAKEQLQDITKIKDKKRGIQYQVNTMKRNLRDIMSKEQAQAMYDTYFKPITENNAKIEQEINSYNERIGQFELTNEESVYTQMLGELKYNPETTLTQQYVEEYYQKHKKNIDKNIVNDAIEEFRNVYDELIDKMNNALESNGLKQVDYRKGYFPHFVEEKPTSILGKLSQALGWKINKGTLPTEIAGITDQFKPNKRWTAFSQQRTGDSTDYNALKGYDNYIRGAMDVIYHTEDIQRLRALENEIRYQYSSKGIQEKIDQIYNDDSLDTEQKNDMIAQFTQDMKNNELGNFATELRNYTDNLANKKSFGDRYMERLYGRETYSVMQNINNRVSANMVGANISSAMTNFIPITQAWSQVSTKNMMRAMYDTIKASIKDDGFSSKSTYLINRTQQAERLYQSNLDKINAKLGIPFETIDSFTSNTIVRAKYYDNIQKGMTESQAIDNANEFAKDVMAGRSKGDMPTYFNQKNPITKLFTAFQLEVNNQFGYMFKDIPVDLADEAKEQIALAFVKMFLGAYLYNMLSQKITGRKAAFSPIDMAIDDISTINNEELNLGEKISNIATDTLKEAPFIGGIMGGGRLPIQGAIPYNNPLEMITSTLSDASAAFDGDPDKKQKAINTLLKEWEKPLFYIAMPFAGGQLKKTKDGLSMYDEKLPIAGSYTNSGNLRFKADTTPVGKIKSALFGQYASQEAQDYINRGYKSVDKRQLQTFKELDLPTDEYLKIKKGITDAGTKNSEKIDYINSLDLPIEKKNILANNILKKDIPVNMENYNNYGSYDEFDYSIKYPSKYKTLTMITDYNSYKNYENEIKQIKQESTNDKEDIINYINRLNLTIPQKAMFIKKYYSSFKDYDSQIISYINNSDLSYEDKVAVYEELGFKIKNGQIYYK